MVVPQGYWTVMRNFGPPSSNPKDYIRGGDFGDLCKQVQEYRIANNLFIGDIEAEVQDWICRNRNAECRPAKPAKPINQGLHLTGTTIARFLATMAEWVAHSGTVDQEEAERRAVICAGCQHCVPAPASGCSGCFGLAARVMRVIGSRTTRMQHILRERFCGQCSCSLEILPFVPLKVLAKWHHMEESPEDTGQREGEKIIGCWKRDWLEEQKKSG
jgi:hypothetical protein